MAVDFISRIHLGQTPAGTGAFSIGYPGMLRGETPLAVMLICQNDNAPLSTNRQTNANQSIGFADGTTEVCVGQMQENAQTIGDTATIVSEALCGLLPDENNAGDPKGTKMEVSFTSFAADKVNLNCDKNEDSIAYSCVAIFFAGDGAGVDVNIAVKDGAGVTVTHNLGQDNQIHFCIGMVQSGTGEQIDGESNYGVVTWDGTTIEQRCVAQNAREDGLAGANMITTFRGDRCLTDGAFDNGVEATGLTNNALTLTEREGTGAEKIYVLSIGTGDSRTFLDDLLHPTTPASDWVVTGVGFKAQIYGFCFPGLIDIDITRNNNDAAAFCLSHFDAEGVEWCNAIMGRHTGSTTSTRNSVNRNFYFGITTTASISFEGHQPTIGTDGFTVAAADLASIGEFLNYFLWAIEDLVPAKTLDVLVVQDAFAIGSATGNEDVTTTRLNGKTPKAVMFIGRTSFAGGGSFSLCYGAADETSEWVVGYCSEDGTSSADTKMTQETNACFFLIDATGGGQPTEFEASFVQFITDGVRINFSDSPGFSTSIVAVFFAGDDIQVEVGTFSASSIPTFTNTLDFGLGIRSQWDALIGARTGDSGASISNNHAVAFGLLSREGGNSTGQCFHTSSDDGAAAATVTYGTFTNEFLRLVDPIGTDAWAISRTASDNLSVTFTKNNNDYNDAHVFGYLAIGMAGLGAIADVVDTPTTAASDWVFTGVGFESQALINHPTAITAANRNATQTDTDGTGINCGAWDASGTDGDIDGNQVVGSEEDGADPMNVGQGIFLSPGGVTNTTFGTLFSINDGAGSLWTPTGWTIPSANIPTADGTARSFLYLALGAVTGAPADPLLQHRSVIRRRRGNPLLRM